MEASPSTTTPLLRRNRWWLLRRNRWWLHHRLRLKTTLSSEISGAIGDLGTFIPIVLTLTLVSHLDISTTLIFTALYNITTGLLFAIPMPVQPMKSIAAVAVSELPHLSPSQIAAAGASTAATLLFLGATGLMSFFYRFIPLPVVRGVQLSQGLSFAFTAVKYIQYNQDFVTSKSTTPRPWLGLDGLVMALSAALFLLLATGSGGEHDNAIQDNVSPPFSSVVEYSSNSANDSSNENNSVHDNISSPISAVVDSSNYTSNSGMNKRLQDKSSRPFSSRVNKRLQVLSAIPAALIVFLIGLVLCFIRDPSIFNDIKFGPSKIKLLDINWEDWKVGFLRGAIPQIPLSVLNSVIAVCKLSADLFPDREVSATRVSISVGIMNLVGCWFGAMPVCHGAGGLAGQYRFGARSGVSVVILGVAKLVIGLVFGNSFVRILSQFPIGILGVLLLFAGIELAMASKDMNTKEESFVMLVCAAVSLTGSSAALGFGCGILLYLVLKLRSMECPSCFGCFRLLQSKSRTSVDDESTFVP